MVEQEQWAELEETQNFISTLALPQLQGTYATVSRNKYNFWQKLRKVFRINLQVMQNSERTEPTK